MHAEKGIITAKANELYTALFNTDDNVSALRAYELILEALIWQHNSGVISVIDIVTDPANVMKIIQEKVIAPGDI